MMTELYVIAAALGLLGAARRGVMAYQARRNDRRTQAYIWSTIVHYK